MTPTTEPSARTHLPVELPACMGGFCQVRASCASYHAANRAYPSERLCSPHRNDMWQPIAVKTQLLDEATQ